MNELDWSTIEGVVTEYQRRYDEEDDSRAFIFCLLDKLFPNCEEYLEDLITDGGNDCGVDAIKIDTSTGNTHVHIFQFKYHKSKRKAGNAFSAKEADKMISFIDRLFDKDDDLRKITNDYLWEKIQEIWEIYQRSDISFTVYFCSNGAKLQAGQKNKVANSLKKYRVAIEEIDFDGLLRMLVSPKTEETMHKFTAVDKQYLGRSDGDIKGMVATITAKDLISIIRNPDDPSKIDMKLFDKNIRVYLGRENPVNNSIIQTALSDLNNYFWYLNNGITVICSGLSYRDNIRSPIVEVKNLQIVNGAQTSNALFEAAKKKPEILEDILLLIKIYETQDTSLPIKIALATNSQTRIFPRDLMANSEIQRKLETAFRSHGYFYERKKNQHQQEQLSYRVDALKLGQIILAYELREPEKSKTDSDKIFGSRYEEIFTKEHNIEHLINMILLSKIVDEERGETNKNKKKNVSKNINYFLTYGHFHVLYVASLLAEKNEVDIASEEMRQKLVNDSLELMASFMEMKANSSLYTLFRNARTKEELYGFVMGTVQLPLPLGLFEGVA